MGSRRKFRRRRPPGLVPPPDGALHPGGTSIHSEMFNGAPRIGVRSDHKVYLKADLIAGRLIRSTSLPL